jgi:hypothetical protein
VYHKSGGVCTIIIGVKTLDAIMENKPLTMLQIRRILKQFMVERSIRELHRQTRPAGKRIQFIDKLNIQL